MTHIITTTSSSVWAVRMSASNVNSWCSDFSPVHFPKHHQLPSDTRCIPAASVHEANGCAGQKHVNMGFFSLLCFLVFLTFLSPQCQQIKDAVHLATGTTQILWNTLLQWECSHSLHATSKDVFFSCPLLRQKSCRVCGAVASNNQTLSLSHPSPLAVNNTRIHSLTFRTDMTVEVRTKVNGS